MKILCIGDVHIKLSNNTEFTEFCDKLFIHIEKAQYDAKDDICILLGDILHDHEKIHTQALNVACNFIEKLRHPFSMLYILVGNHDALNASQFLSKEHWMNVLKNWAKISIVDTVFCETILINSEMVKLVLVPYVPPGRFIEALDTITPIQSWSDADFIFAHQEVSGAQMGAIISNAETWALNNPVLISGHIHDYQQPQDNIIYTGSCFQHAFGETGKNVLLQLEFIGSNNSCVDAGVGGNMRWCAEWINLQLSRKITVKLDIDDVKKMDILMTKHIKNTLRLVIRGTAAEYKAFCKTTRYKTLTKKKIKIAFHPVPIKIKEEIAHVHKSKCSTLQPHLLSFSDTLKALVEKDVHKMPELLYAFNSLSSPEDNDLVIKTKMMSITD